MKAFLLVLALLMASGCSDGQVFGWQQAEESGEYDY